SSTCRDRFCVPCSDTRSAHLANRIRARVPPGGISFLTLTLADPDDDLTTLLDKLLKYFRRLRAWSVWKRRVTGGVAFIEIKWNEAKQRWHPHIHAIMESAFIPQAEISDRWKAITTTSFIVHIKRPKNAETVIRYVTKYGSKPLDQSFVANENRLDMAIEALKGRHLCTVFGEWRGWALHDDEDRGEWQPIAPLWQLVDRERRGDPDATAIMEQLRCNTKMELTPPTLARAPPVQPLQVPEYLQQLRHSASIAATALRTGLGSP
ncbi:MAG: protein rep, partial [Gemmatimonadetes bacterium]|nr:protein rep [Gemmatimonadota bacterium]